MLQENPGPTYARAARLLDEMDRLRLAWRHVRPAPPLKKSDTMILGMLTHAEAHRAGPVSVGKLAKMAHQSPPGISQKLGELEAGGFVRRRPGKQDRRVATVELTAKGRKAAKQSFEQMLALSENALSTLGEADAEALLALLDKLNTSIEAAVQATAAQAAKGDEPT